MDIATRIALTLRAEETAMAGDHVRYGLLVWEALRILRDASAPMQSRQIAAAVGERIRPTPYESELHRSGGSRIV